MGDTTASNVNIRLSASGQQQVVAAFAQIGAVSSSLNAALSKLGYGLSIGTLVTAATAAAASLVHLVSKGIDTADTMGKTAQKAGQLVEEFSALSYSAKLADLSQETL